MADKKQDDKPAYEAPEDATPAQQREAEVYAERLKAANQKYDCCIKTRPECEPHLAVVRELAKGDDDVAFIVRAEITTQNL